MLCTESERRALTGNIVPMACFAGVVSALLSGLWTCQSRCSARVLRYDQDVLGASSPAKKRDRVLHGEVVSRNANMPELPD